MAECFCGCGESVGLRDRGINKQGQRTVDLLAKLSESRSRVAGLPPPADIVGAIALLDSLIDDGKWYEEMWTKLRHSDPQSLPPPSAVRDFKRQWTGWGKVGMHVSGGLLAYDGEDFRTAAEGLEAPDNDQ